MDVTKADSTTAPTPVCRHESSGGGSSRAHSGTTTTTMKTVIMTGSEEDEEEDSTPRVTSEDNAQRTPISGNVDSRCKAEDQPEQDGISSNGASCGITADTSSKRAALLRRIDAQLRTASKLELELLKRVYLIQQKRKVLTRKRHMLLSKKAMKERRGQKSTSSETSKMESE